MTALAGTWPPLTIDGDIDRIVIVAPHPDDETLSTGLLLMVAAEQRIPVTVVAVTDGEAAYTAVAPDTLAAIRRREQLTALAELGHPDVLQRFGHPDGHVTGAESALQAALEQQLTADSLLVAPSEHDWHPDHQACGRAARRAASLIGCRHWSSLFWAHHHPDDLIASAPVIRELRSDSAHTARRRTALAHHDSQLRGLGGPPILDAVLLAHLEEPRELYVVEPEPSR